MNEPALKMAIAKFRGGEPVESIEAHLELYLEANGGGVDAGALAHNIMRKAIEHVRATGGSDIRHGIHGGVLGHRIDRTLGTITAKDYHALTAAFLLKYYGAEGRGQAQGLEEPLHTVTAKHRFGLITVHGERYAIVDIGMRMLQPHELFAAQGFPTDYVIDPEFKGRPLTKTAQISLAGNSVCPQVAEAIVTMNVALDARRVA